MKKPTKILTYAFLALFISGCSWLAPHKRDIQQGNLLDQKDLDQLEVGMRQDQVSYLLGNPLLTPLGQPNQWDYFYQLRRGEQLKARQKVSIRFEPAEDGQLRVAYIDFKEDTLNVEHLEELTPSAEDGPPPSEATPSQPSQPGPATGDPSQVPGQGQL